MEQSKTVGKSVGLSNQLAASSSPYVRSHKDDPVAWQEWSPAAIELAKKYNRLIFLSIGYHACHWCHVMQHESFKSPEVAKVLNSSFIPIKLDREARPDLDEIYMNYVTATTGSGGWPLNLFLTPDLDPVFGGTYWPGPGITSPQSGRRGSTAAEPSLSFLDILGRMQDIWSNQQDRCLLSAQDATQQLRSFAAEGMYSDAHTKSAPDAPEPLDLDLLDDALSHFKSRYDPVHAGFSPSSPSGPKFSTAPNLAFLLRIGASITTTSTRFGFPSPVPPILGKKACIQAASMALQTLATMSRSGLRDHLGHGFHRYSVTPDWNLPHFEKMLPDNALLLSCYCDAWALSKDPEILGTIYSLVEYFTDPDSPTVNHEGGWYSSEDADSRASNTHSNAEAREGAYYLWTFKEFESVLGDDDALVLARHFGVTANGNVPAEHDAHDEFLTQNVLHITATPSVLAKEFGMSESDIITIIKSGKAKLAAHRATFRPPPAVDTKIVTAYNALAISALGHAANTLAEIDTSRSERCKAAALKGGAFLQQHNYNTSSAGRLLRYARFPNADDNDNDPPFFGESDPSSFVDDYAYLTTAFLTLYDLTFDTGCIADAKDLQTYLETHFLDADAGGYFQAPSFASDEHIVRLKPGTDTALPSPNGVIAMNLLYLASYTSALEPENTDAPREYVEKAKTTIDAFAVEMIQHPFLFVGLLGAVVFDAVGIRSLIVQGPVPERDVRAVSGWGRTVVRTKGEERKILVCENGACRDYVDGELDKDPEYEDEESAEGDIIGEDGKEAVEAQNVALLREKARLEQERAEAESRRAVLESEKREIEEAQGVVERTISQ